MVYVGVDVDKNKLKGCLLFSDGRKRPKSVNNDAKGFQALLDFATRAAKVKVDELAFVMEATGVYYEQAALSLHDAGATVYVVNGARIKHFKKSEGIQTKTDEVDAQVLAQFGQFDQHRSDKLQPYTPEPKGVRELKQLIARLDALEKDLQRESNRQHAALISKAPDAVQASLQEVMKELERQKKKLEEQIDDHIDQDPEIRANTDLLKSIPGIADKTAPRLVALLASRRFESAKAAAAFVGLAVEHDQSGESQGRSTITKNGSGRLRSALYFPAITATRHNPPIQRLAERMKAAGKPKMKIIAAAMRKLIHIAYGVLKNQMPFSPNHALPA